MGSKFKVWHITKRSELVKNSLLFFVRKSTKKSYEEVQQKNVRKIATKKASEWTACYLFVVFFALIFAALPVNFLT